MSFLEEIAPYLSPYHSDRVYAITQLGATIIKTDNTEQQPQDADLFIVGCGEFRGQLDDASYSNGPDIIRNELYKLHCWHPSIKICDLGNIIQGVSKKDTEAALKTVIYELESQHKKILIIGGSHDLTLQQYQVCASLDKIIDFTVVDMLADLDDTSGNRYDNHLMQSLTGMPNFVRHFNLLGFQSYYVNPELIETFDKLRFDCIRVGKAREDIEQLEPVFRSSDIASFDINAIRYSDAPANLLGSPNGFYGDEMCKLTRFAGMSEKLRTIGIYGYRPELDRQEITAKLIAQMIWYLIDGIQVAKSEADFEDRNQYAEYYITFTDNNTLFLKSKRTNRWWMRLPNEKFIPCTYKDYITATSNEIPERWMREVERMIL